MRDANGNGRADVGERVTFTAVVRNTGTVAVTRLRVSGSLADLRCATRTLAPGASTTCTVTVVVRQGDIVAGGLTNTVMAQGRGAEQGTVATSHRTAALAAGALPVALASTGVDLVTPVGWAAGLLLLALIGAVVLRRRAVRTRRR